MSKPKLVSDLKEIIEVLSPDKNHVTEQECAKCRLVAKRKLRTIIEYLEKKLVDCYQCDGTGNYKDSTDGLLSKCVSCNGTGKTT